MNLLLALLISFAPLSSWFTNSFAAELKVNLPQTSTKKTLIEIGMSDPDFKLFYNLARGMKDGRRLYSGEPFTIFAAKNLAFSSISLIALNEMWIPTAYWTEIFWHHVVSGMIDPENLVRSTMIQPVSGNPLKITTTGGMLYVDSVPVLSALVSANGIVYTLDSLLLTKANRDLILEH